MSETKNPLGLSTIPSVSSEGLVPVGRRTSLRSYLAALWNRRHFIIAESRAKMSSSTRKNLLGYGWLFLNPLLSVLAFWFIFGFILQSSRGIDNFIGYLVIGVFFFQYTGKSMTGGTGAIRSGASMIKGFQFPRAALPISTVVRNFLDFIPTVVVMVILIAVIPPAEVITWRVALVIPVIILQTIFNVGLACFLARLGHKIPDLTNFMSIVSRFWLYGSGVFFSIEDRLGDHPASARSYAIQSDAFLSDTGAELTALRSRFSDVDVGMDRVGLRSPHRRIPVLLARGGELWSTLKSKNPTSSRRTSKFGTPSTPTIPGSRQKESGA